MAEFTSLQRGEQIPAAEFQGVDLHGYITGNQMGYQNLIVQFINMQSQ
jgi:hypothetical protein